MSLTPTDISNIEKYFQGEDILEKINECIDYNMALLSYELHKLDTFMEKWANKENEYFKSIRDSVLYFPLLAPHLSYDEPYGMIDTHATQYFEEVETPMAQENEEPDFNELTPTPFSINRKVALKNWAKTLSRKEITIPIPEKTTFKCDLSGNLLYRKRMERKRRDDFEKKNAQSKAVAE